MKKTLKNRILALAAALMMAAAVVVPVTVAPVTAEAATSVSYKALSAGTWAASSYQSGKGYTYYKVTVSKPGMLTFSFKTVKDTDYPSVYIRDNKSDLQNPSGHKGSYKYVSYSSDLKSVAVEAGTYYLDVSSGKCKYTYKAMPSQVNYSVAKATKLAANTKVTAMFTPKRNYARWYKITNPSAKKISIWSNTGINASNIEVYNSKLKKIQMVEAASSLKYTSKAKLAKGTYYIRIKSTNMYYSDYDYRFGNVVTLKWK